jgi:polar amino acid transport system substrate-binding protein
MKPSPIVLALVLACCMPQMAWSANVSMAFGDRIPPFSFPETNSGIELEVIGEALAVRGHVLKPVYFPFARVPHEFKAGTVDASMTDGGQDLTPYGAFYGDSAVVYDNVFITLAERKLKINTPADLAGLSVISFNGAEKRYPQWLDAVVKAGHFTAQNNQALQVKTLEMGRYDVVLSDRTIFRYFTQQQAQGHPLKPTVVHAFTTVNPQDYRPLFRDRQVRDDFNAGLKQLKASGRFQAIYDKYLIR